MKVLVTGVAGFIGCETALHLLARGDTVVGIDNLNSYYKVSLKQARLQRLGVNDAFEMAFPLQSGASVQKRSGSPGFTFVGLDLANTQGMQALFAEECFDAVVHLGAQAGVRYSLENPHAYMQSNIIGHLNILEGCRNYPVKHLVYASSSSVYGNNGQVPFSVEHSVDHPVSLYAASKKSNELMAHSYSHLYNIPTTGLRFFTVYGPWGRPDMAPMLFAKAILEGRAIKVFNNGNMQRDFTYIDDIVQGIVRVLDIPAVPQEDWSGSSSGSWAPYRVFNIGNGSPVSLLHFIETLENALGKQAVKQMQPMQPGDVPRTWADTSSLQQLTGFIPNTPLHKGIGNLVQWLQSYGIDF
jgi:UDP-glucuronate 4-epimerase